MHGSMHRCAMIVLQHCFQHYDRLHSVRRVPLSLVSTLGQPASCPHQLSACQPSVFMFFFLSA
jgi:hypothetical protein